MPTRRMNHVVSQLRFLAARTGPGGTSDADFIERFLARKDEFAFESLVRRHRPMVLGVCRRLLDDEYDAEDAFQATFLVLFRKVPSLRPESCVSPWLYRVARRTALKARSLDLRRPRAETAAGLVGWTEGTLSGRLARRKEMLGGRFAAAAWSRRRS